MGINIRKNIKKIMCLLSEAIVVAMILSNIWYGNLEYVNATNNTVLNNIIKKNDNNFIRKNIIDINNITDFVTPEMFGAVGNGSSDDTEAIKKAISSGLPVKFTNIYVIRSRIFIEKNCIMFGGGTILVQNTDATVFQATNRELDYIMVKSLKFEMTQGKSLSEQQNLFFNDIVKLKLLSLEDVTINMYGDNGYIVTNSNCIEHYIFNRVTVNNLSTNSLGGCIWAISKVDTIMEINDCNFTQVPKDEILSVANHKSFMGAKITCIVNNSNFVRLNNPNVSRGFSIRGWRGSNIYMQFNNCSFKMSDDDNLLSMSGKGCTIEMNTCNISGNPIVCVFGGYETFDKGTYDYMLNNCVIDTMSDVCGNYEHSSQMASPNILFSECMIKGKTLFKVRNNTQSYVMLLSKASNCDISVDYVVETQGVSYGVMTINDCTLRVYKEIEKYNTSKNSSFRYPLKSNFSSINNTVVKQ